MKKDQEIQKNVMEELMHTPSVDPAAIGVAVKNGIVTLSGTVDSFPKKIAAERAAMKVKNVVGIAENIEVKLNGKSIKSDTQIAQAVLYSLEWHSGLDPEKIKILVENGVVTLEGNVDWDYQRKLAFRTVSNITGVKRVISNIRIADHPLPSQVKRRIEAAFLRNAHLDPMKINVAVDGNKVTLSGKVRSYGEKKEAENTVWKMAGVTDVVNRLEYEESFDPSEII